MSVWSLNQIQPEIAINFIKEDLSTQLTAQSQASIALIFHFLILICHNVNCCFIFKYHEASCWNPNGNKHYIATLRNICLSIENPYEADSDEQLGKWLAYKLDLTSNTESLILSDESEGFGELFEVLFDKTQDLPRVFQFGKTNEPEQKIYVRLITRMYLYI